MESSIQGLASCICGIALAQNSSYSNYATIHALMLLKKT